MTFLPRPRPRVWDPALEYPAVKQFQVDVTLDPATAGPEVILSPDLREASWGSPSPGRPAGPGRFDRDPCVLGREGFASGRHYWEVEARGRFWALGVARESARRQGWVLFQPSAEIWALHKCDQQLCVAPAAPGSPPVPLPDGGVGVALHCERGQVSFYALRSRRRVCTLQAASCRGERLFPFFCVLLSTIRLPPKG